MHTAQLLQVYVNSHRDEKKHREPFELPMPWTAATEQEPDVSTEERERLRALLARRSAFQP